MTPELPEPDIDFGFLIKLTAAHCRAARGWLGWTQAELSRRSGVGLSAIKDYEKESRRTHKGVQILLQNAFAKAGVLCSDGGIYEEPEDMPDQIGPY